MSPLPSASILLKSATAAASTDGASPSMSTLTLSTSTPSAPLVISMLTRYGPSSDAIGTAAAAGAAAAAGTTAAAAAADAAGAAAAADDTAAAGAAVTGGLALGAIRAFLLLVAFPRATFSILVAARSCSGVAAGSCLAL